MNMEEGDYFNCLVDSFGRQLTEPVINTTFSRTRVEKLASDAKLRYLGRTNQRGQVGCRLDLICRDDASYRDLPEFLKE